MQITPLIQSVFEKTKPVCFTRFLIDVPVTAKVVYGRMTVDIEILREAGMADKLDLHISEQILHDREENEIFRGDGDADKLSGIPIYDTRRGIAQLVTIKAKNEYAVRTYRSLNNDIYEFVANDIRGHRQVQSELARQASLIMAMRSRAEDEIPYEEGICLDGAFIPASPQYENIQVGIRFAEFPDIHLSIYALKSNGYVPSESYFWRRFKDAEESARADGFGAWYDNIRQLRKGNKQAGIWSGVELLARIPPQPNRKGSDYHQFMFQASGKENDRFYPNADIQLDTGISNNIQGKVPVSLSDEELIALWDKLLSSIRIREVSVPKPISDAPQVGLMLPQGALCPADGWWECSGLERDSAGNKVKGGKIQFFRANVILPGIAFIQPSNLLQRYSRKNLATRPVGKVFWTLVRVDNTPASLAAVGNPAVIKQLDVHAKDKGEL